ncbi:thyrotroph embryonic factor isoform X1 [Octopus bimaculoides]|uniref:BZIP domain-containing protein n=1 Tax=Octopus bimaculoides TaxID=37653 RepID=A0A0L8H0P0_OCTBM|nr:thyrotroph embryonic factor isoform X1 [Octopus bimaculoides]|eukprot:XP_014776528.1 PREDICTED: thyrotroph embryonic factor-like isoform X1 [Octopus bimaculoides]
MSSYNSCATYTLLQSSFRYAKPQLPLGSFNHQNFNHSSNYSTGQSAIPSSISKSLPPTASSNNGNNHTFNWHYPVKTDGTVARRNCMRESLNRHGTTCYPGIRSTIVKEESSKYSDDEQNNLSAFLGPNLWEKSSGADFKLEYMDLDEFLVENGIPLDPVNDSLDSNDKNTASDVSLDSFVQSPEQVNFKVKEEDLHSISSDSTAYKQDDNDLIPEDDDQEDEEDEDEDDDDDDEDEDDDDDSNCNSDVFEPPKPGRSQVPGKNGFDPAKRKFSSDELKPQPLVKKSKKIFVPLDRKDEKYWARRKKNNIAAKRSRDARRVKENQIALRANFLESENQNLREKMAKVLKDMSQIKKEKDTLKSDNDFLRKQLSKYSCQ